MRTALRPSRRRRRSRISPATLPLAFSQVREDARIDAAALGALPPGARVALIASGGDTAAWLVAGGRVGILHLVDLNPAQLALTRLKLHLLARETPRRRREILGHAPPLRGRRGPLLRGLERELALPTGCLGPAEYVARVGPDYAGRYEWVFAQLRAALAPWRSELEALLALSDPVTQAAAVAPGSPLGDELATAFAEALSLEQLIALFGPEATRNPRQTFHAHFLGQLRQCLGSQPARTNPFLAQMLLGRFAEAGAYPWLDAIPSGQPPLLHWHGRPMDDVLGNLRAESLDFVHLSNILDWLPPAAAARLLRAVFAALRPGGRVLIRQLNSTLDIPACGPDFRWLLEEAAALHARDQSFFYRALHLAERPLP